MTSFIRVPAGSEPIRTYWKATGFSNGYMGMQRNSGTERRILFSVFYNKQGSTIEILDSHPDAFVEKFTNSGKGAHAHIIYDWKAGQTVFFEVTAAVDTAKNGTAYSGYYSTDNEKNWTLIASFFAFKELDYLKGLYGFLQNFSNDCSEIREGFYGNFSVTDITGKKNQSY